MLREMFHDLAHSDNSTTPWLFHCFTVSDNYFFHFIPQPVLGIGSLVTSFPAITQSNAFLKSDPSVSISFPGREPSSCPLYTHLSSASNKLKSGVQAAS